MRIPLYLGLRAAPKRAAFFHTTIRMAAQSSVTKSNVDFLSQRPVPCMLNNELLTTSDTFKVHDPHEAGKTLHEVYCVNEAEALKVVEIAAKAFKSWRDTALSHRREIFTKAAALLRERVKEYSEIEVEETTSNAMWAGFEVGVLSVDQLTETAAAANYLKGEILATEGQRAYIERHPFGVVLGIAPWNAPLTLSIRAVGNALMAGNTVILKTSEYSPRVHMIVAQLFAEAGLPPGVLSVIHVSTKSAPAVVEAIIAHPAVGKVNFTGSTAVGAKIAQTAAKHLKPTVMELGGNAPLVVLPSADIQMAVSATVFGAYLHSGQICMATNTAIVHHSVADEFSKALAAKVQAYTAGKGPESFRGLFTEASARRIRANLKDATDKGGKILAGEMTNDGHQNLIQPILLDNVDKSMKIFAEENFAPVASIVRFDTDEEAIELANAHEYGLAASVYGKDEGHAYRIAKRIDAGMVHINGATVHDINSLPRKFFVGKSLAQEECAYTSPDGGWKKSGWGRFNGIEGLKEFTQIKVITVNDAHMYPL